MHPQWLAYDQIINTLDFLNIYHLVPQMMAQTVEVRRLGCGSTADV